MKDLTAHRDPSLGSMDQRLRPFHSHCCACADSICCKQFSQVKILQILRPQQGLQAATNGAACSNGPSRKGAASFAEARTHSCC